MLSPSSLSDQKIEEIAKGIDGIKVLLQGLNISLGTKQQESGYPEQLKLGKPADAPPSRQFLPESASKSSILDHSVHIIEFLKTVLDDQYSKNDTSEASEVISSLKSLVAALENNHAGQSMSFSKLDIAKRDTNPPMPPVEVVVAALRWAKEHDGYDRIVWIANILPLNVFTDICRKVCFAVDDYSETDLAIANGYLSYIFAEHVGLQDYIDYSQLCQKNLHSALLRLPLIMPPSMEVIAALTIGAFNAIQDSKAIMAWTFISAASNHCQTLGYHRHRSAREIDQTLKDVQDRLFWTVYRFDKSLSLRLGRSSSFRDSDIELPFDVNTTRPTMVARIQGRVYDQLYSPMGLSRPYEERGHEAELLAEQLRELISATHIEASSANSQLDHCGSDPMRVVYLQFDLVCQTSLLALILRAIPSTQISPSDISGECVAVARDALNAHEQCMTSLRGHERDPFMFTKYISWAVLHIPFIPFSILFTHTVQHLDFADLARLDCFAASLRPKAPSQTSITHPHRLYEILCRAARIYIAPETSPSHVDLFPDSGPLDPSEVSGFTCFDWGADDETRQFADAQSLGLEEWYYSNQQIMSLLDENVTI
ncbi:hypothetical protein TruAng_005044 [Truncatella angustata]|nr:hypothetical protein TruAng_005044 [Truncatella angustata]